MSTSPATVHIIDDDEAVRRSLDVLLRFRNTFLHDPRIDAFASLGEDAVRRDDYGPGRQAELRKRLADFDLVVVPVADGREIVELWL